MSTVKYYPNWPNLDPEYEIGTADFEYTKGSFSKLIGDAIRSIYRGLRLPVNLLLGAIDGNGALCPTYGLWGGQGWSGGVRGSSIDWAKSSAPCYNNSIRDIETNPDLDTKTCYSLVDAICKTHDWRYDQAEKTYAKDSVEYKAAILNADKLLLEEIASALGSKSYSAPQDVPWTLKSFDGCNFDSEESLYLTGLVPLFMAKIATVDIAGVVSAEAKEAVNSILKKITINETTFENPTDSSKKTIYSVENGFLITREESASNINAWIIDLNSDAKPVNINIAYGADSTKADSLFVIGENGNIRINSGTGHNEITILGATNDTIAKYTFEIADGGGDDTYYLDSNFSYKLIDNEANAIYVNDENGQWTKINTLFENTEDNSWESQDGSITLADNTITLANDSTIELNTDVQPDAFGINLIEIPENPTQIFGDRQPEDLNDILYGTTASDQMIGLTGIDLIYGGAGKDEIFVSNYGEMGTLIAAGETAPNQAGTGELADGGDGDDFVYGTNAYDLLCGCAGNDLLVGGGGDDVIYGDGIIWHSNLRDYAGWSYNIIPTEIPNAQGSYTQYTVYFHEISGVLTDVSISGEDVIYAGTGNDFVCAGSGDDEVYGGTGSDIMWGDAGNDFIFGGDGNDILDGDSGPEFLFPDRNGNDYIDGGTGDDQIFGEGGNDNLYGGVGNDTIYGGTGDDYLKEEVGENELYGEAGNDEIFGGTGNDYIEGDNTDVAGDDYLDGGDGDDTIIGAGGADIIYGGDGNDQLHGDAANVALADQGNDYIDGEDGDDLISGYGGNDQLYGGSGNDYVCAGSGDDEVYGGTGNDIMWGEDGNDFMEGGAGNDSIFGGNLIRFRKKLKYQNKWRRVAKEENLRRAA